MWAGQAWRKDQMWPAGRAILRNILHHKVHHHDTMTHFMFEKDAAQYSRITKSCGSNDSVAYSCSASVLLKKATAETMRAACIFGTNVGLLAV